VYQGSFSSFNLAWHLKIADANSRHEINILQIRLLQTSDLYVSRHELRKICQHASRKRHKAAEVLMYGLLGEVFTLEEMAESRGLGLSKPKPEDANRPVLDETKIAVLKGVYYGSHYC